MDQPSDILVFGLGCLGALAQEIVRLYRLRSRPPKRGFSWFYVIVSVLYASLGGVVALVLPAVTMQAALFAGVSTPLWIATVAKHLNGRELIANSADSDGVGMRSGSPIRDILRTHANGIFGQEPADIQ